MEERLARIALAAVVEPGGRRLSDLLELHGAIEVWSLLRSSGDGWGARARLTDPAEVMRRTEACGARFLIPGDPEWPGGPLADLSFADPVQDIGGLPVGLWVQGPLDLAQATAASVAVVGSRAATAYGETVAMDFGAGLAERGCCVISGGAYGIDAAAHRGALAADGPTVGVLACGVDTDYPVGHASLFGRMRSDHLLVSELPPGEHPTRRRFLVRNRLIAALAQATLVVEAATRSGAGNTAAWASALGRPLLAVPGPVHSATSATPHRLIREQRATLVTQVADVLEAIAPLGVRLGPSESDEAHSRPLDRLEPLALAVREAIPARGGASAAEVAIAAQVDVATCLAVLADLEERGLARRDERGTWRTMLPSRRSAELPVAG